MSIATVLADPRAPSSEREGVAFPILLAAGAVESLYCGDGIPRLYVLDPTGSIRFDRHGWFHDENGRNRHDWMIEAPLRTER